MAKATEAKALRGLWYSFTEVVGIIDQCNDDIAPTLSLSGRSAVEAACAEEKAGFDEKGVDDLKTIVATFLASQFVFKSSSQTPQCMLVMTTFVQDHNITLAPKLAFIVQETIQRIGNGDATFTTPTKAPQQRDAGT